MQVVASSAVTDGLGARYLTEYSYHNACYDGWETEFRGFGEARAKTIGDANSLSAAIDLFDAEFGGKEGGPVGSEGRMMPSEDEIVGRVEADSVSISGSGHTPPSAFTVDRPPSAAHAAARRRMTGRWERPA